MKIKTGDFVMPGDFLSVSEQYLPGFGAYEDDGEIKSSVPGNVSIDNSQKEVSVVSKSGGPNLLKVGDFVYGEVKDVHNQRALITVHSKKGSNRQLALPYRAAIHISQVSSGYLDRLTDAYRIGDIVEAKVIKVVGDNIDLNTEDEDCGVVKAMCSRCRSYLINSDNVGELYCENCERNEKRKISQNYDY